MYIATIDIKIKKKITKTRSDNFDPFFWLKNVQNYTYIVDPSYFFIISLFEGYTWIKRFVASSNIHIYRFVFWNIYSSVVIKRAGITKKRYPTFSICYLPIIFPSSLFFFQKFYTAFNLGEKCKCAESVRVFQNRTRVQSAFKFAISKPAKIETIYRHDIKLNWTRYMYMYIRFNCMTRAFNDRFSSLQK